MSQTFVVIGAGQAGGWGAKTLRDQGFAGRIVLIGDEPHPPHERPPLSKEVLFGAKPPESTHLFPADKFAAANIESRPGVRATKIDRAGKRLELQGGETLGYDRLLLTMGSRVRRLDMPGSTLAGIHYLRSIEDSLAIKRDLQPGAQLLVVGGGWIGLEAAAAGRKAGAHVTVIEAADQLCGRALPPGLGGYLHDLHSRNGVVVRLKAGLKGFAGSARVERALLSTGEELPVTTVVIGIGILPNVELARDAGIEVDDGIVVDEYGRTSDPDIFAAGDVTKHPNRFTGRKVRLESWANAQNQAIAAAKAMLDKPETYNEIPWFWSDQYNVNLQVLGLPMKFDRIVMRGERARDQFLEFFLTGTKIEAVAAINNPRDLRFAKRAMQQNKDVDPARLEDTSVSLQEILK
jgi:3-phenylpropionate/trans-cinnamate dioxygenase ferredoxin reductase subunit